jgi:hypothetical protein
MGHSRLDFVYAVLEGVGTSQALKGIDPAGSIFPRLACCEAIDFWVTPCLWVGELQRGWRTAGKRVPVS